ncbi:uncharacterized protein LOC115451454 isoform X3 [Manduca sexta]|nr:uncharacterized protein LOC115451454 isoform X3 [Manduca sexta]XP_037297950.1 uncharacterized protein LOC115451454 isoform X3 [Manduca sexta]XP_037297982.1 uncharacterized protein LOC115451454 isoform X3 [Manduca sexta]
MGQTDKDKLMILALALLKDAKLKLRQVSGIKDEHGVMVAFDVGIIIGQIREKYKRMLETYRDARDRFTNRTQLQGPGVRKFRPLHYIISMELVHMREVDIDKLIHVLETIPKKVLEKGARPYFKDRVKNDTLRNGDFETKLALRIKEEELKSKYRDEYTMKRLGINKTGWAWDIYSIS